MRTELPKILNLSDLAGRHDLRIVEPMPPQIVIEAETQIRRDDAEHKRRKDWLLFRAGLCAWIGLGLLCIWLVLGTPAGAERNWALATLTAMITGLICYFSGRRQSAG